MIIKRSKPFSEGRAITFGKHQGKLFETIALNFADYILWCDQELTEPGYDWLHKYTQKLVDNFDAKPFLNAKCAGKIGGQTCGNAVTRFSVQQRQSSPVFFCATCDPFSISPDNGTVEVHDKYYDALWFLDRGEATRQQKRDLIRRIATAKGLTGKKDQDALDFFYAKVKLLDGAAACGKLSTGTPPVS